MPFFCVCGGGHFDPGPLDGSVFCGLGWSDPPKMALPPSWEEATDEMFCFSEMWMAFPMISLLPRRKRMIFLLVCWDGLSFEATSPNESALVSSPEDVCLAVKGRAVR